MATKHGILAAVGCAKSSGAWNAADGNGKTLIAGDGLPVIVGSGFGNPEIVRAELDIWNRSFFRYPDVKTGESWNSGFQTRMGFTYNLRPIAHVFGAEAVSEPNSGEGKHVFTFADEVEASHLTLAGTDGATCRDVEAYKPSGFTMTWNQNDLGVMDHRGIGRKELTDGSGANTFASMASVTLPSAPSKRFHGLNDVQSDGTTSVFTVRVDSASTGALSSADDMSPTQVVLTVNRGGWVLNRSPTSGLYFMEPVGGEWIEFGLALTFDRSTDETWKDFFRAATELKATIDIDSGVTIDSTLPYRWFFELPSLSPTEHGNDISTPTALGETVTLMGRYAWTAPTGITVQEPQLTVWDALTTTHLAA